MSTRQSRTDRRATQREVLKLARKQAQAAALRETVALEEKRAATNRANAAHSTGPRTPEGKAKSSQNAFKHGLFSKQLVAPNENPADLDRLRADLRAQHQPANTTEEILVNEMAEQYWRLRRMRRLEVACMNWDDSVQGWFQLLPLMQRSMSAAERGFYKAHAELQKLQKARGFDPAISHAEPETGFVSPNPAPPPAPEPQTPGFVPANPVQSPCETSHPEAPEPPARQQMAA